MAVEATLNESWSTNRSIDTIFKMRAQAEDAYNVITDTIELMTGSLEGSRINTEIESEGQSILNILNTAKTELDKHSKFILWRQPE